jgi:hypothetical protein
MHENNRRGFLKNSGAVLATGVFGSFGLNAIAAEHEPHSEHGGQMKSQKGVNAFVVSAKEEGICGTCRFWGGIRRASEDKKKVFCESLGWCNNPDSHHYQTMTTPATGPMKSWKKWEAL